VDTARIGADAVMMLDRLVRKEGDLPRLQEYECNLIIGKSTQRKE